MCDWRLESTLPCVTSIGVARPQVEANNWKWHRALLICKRHKPLSGAWIMRPWQRMKSKQTGNLEVFGANQCSGSVEIISHCGLSHWLRPGNLCLCVESTSAAAAQGVSFRLAAVLFSSFVDLSMKPRPVFHRFGCQPQSGNWAGTLW